MNDKKSRELFNRAIAKLPGGVNSPVRAWSAVGGAPIFIKHALGPFIYDADDNRFIDYVCSYGPAILGHAHPRVVAALADQAKLGLGFGATTAIEVELAELISGAIKCAESVRLVSSGTEAGMTALRLARAATGRSKIIKFDGCYHGHSDSLLVKAGSGGMTLGVADSGGVPAALAALTLVARYNSVESVDRLFASARGEVAAIIVEPVAANMGVVPPLRNFLPELADLAHREGALLIADEVITGFRLNFGAISEAMGVTPDLIMLGKVIGGGMPVGAVAGSARVMDLLAPRGPVYQAGTLSGNPLSVRAGLETLKILRETNPYATLDALGARLESGFRKAFATEGVTAQINRAGSMLTTFVGTSARCNDADDARKSDTQLFAKFFHALLERGINLAPSQFEAMFVSSAHDEEIIDQTVAAAEGALAGLHDASRVRES